MQTQRMILWIVFSMSLLFLWDAWQRHNGQPSLFGPSPTVQTDTGAEPGTPTTGAAGSAADPSIPPAPSTASQASGEAPTGASTASSQPIRLQNDVLAIDIDTLGGQVRPAELL